MSSGFVTEAELEEARRVRQEEWERVRKPDQPVGMAITWGVSRGLQSPMHFLIVYSPIHRGS